MARLQATISAVVSSGALGSALTSAGLGPILRIQTVVYYHEDTTPNPAPED